MCIGNEEVVISYDVPSLLTSVPIDESAEMIHRMLDEDTTLEDRTVLSPDRIAEMLKVCLKFTYFSYQSEIYQQKEGIAMGSPFSAVITNLYRPCLWGRYMDDTSLSSRRGQKKSF